MDHPDFQKPRDEGRMLLVEEAQERVLAEVTQLGIERVSLMDALGRTLREEVLAPRDVPQADNTAMDGYAVRADDIARATKDSPAVLRVIEDLPAGSVPSKEVMSGAASRIMTGASIPTGADTVAHVEITDGGSESVRVFQPLTRGTNVRRRGEDMVAGHRILATGQLLGAAEIGVLAGAQKFLVSVSRRPTVAILSTGDEVVDVDQPVPPGKVVNSNSYSLASMTRMIGALPRMMGIVPDERNATMAAIEAATESDFIISSGGVSVGAYDFVKDALEALGGETKFWQVAMKPGKPIVLSRVREKLYFGLPGNPVSCMVSFHLFVAPAIRRAMGQTEGIFPPVVLARLEGTLKSRGDRRNYQRVRLVTQDGELVAIPMLAQGSGVSTSMIRANGLAIAEAGVTELPSGSRVPVAVIGPL